jgi:16S rRNA (guanine527-N7)-methyltransferase
VEHETELRQCLLDSTRELGLNLDNEQVDRFMCYLALLLEWNQITNLTSITNPHEVVIKHFVDSLTALTCTNFPAGAVVLDVGSGAGFPGIPLKIARSDIQLVLIEPTQKKCSFLSSIAGRLKLKDVSVFSGTIREYVAQATLLSADIMTLRALRFDEISEWAMRVLKTDGKVVLYRAARLEKSDVRSGLIIETEKSFLLPSNCGNRVISILAHPITS